MRQWEFTDMLNPLPIPDWALTIVLPINRWAHIVCTTALVGGTLFYEFVIPRAIEELKDEAQLAVLGRVRWVFRQIVVVSALILITTGAVSTWRIWPTYQGTYGAAKLWWLLHVILGLLALGIAIGLTLGNRVPRHPLGWMRVNFVILLLVIFVASVARYIRVSMMEQIEKANLELIDQNSPR
jgi:hypothetical protein